MIYYSTENVAAHKHFPKANQEWVQLKDAEKLEAENAELKVWLGEEIARAIKDKLNASGPNELLVCQTIELSYSIVLGRLNAAPKESEG